MNNTIAIAQNNTDFAELVCEQIHVASNWAIEHHGRFSFVLSGGNTPKAIFTHLVDQYLDKINWSKTDFFWIDERCVPSDHKDSNYRLTENYLLSKIQSVGSVYRIKTENEPKNAAIEYQKDIGDFFRSQRVQFDFILLGMGTDGHVASIFPDMLDDLHVLPEVFCTRSPYNGYYRIGLNLNYIQSARNKLLLVIGDDKLAILKSNNKKYPINNIDNMHIVYMP